MKKTTDPFKSEDYDLADEMFRQATVDNLAEEENVSAIKEAFYADAGKAFKDGKFITTVERLIADHLWQRVNNKAQTATRRVLRELQSGQLSIPVESWMEQVVTVGKHRRSTVGALGQPDFLRMVQARQDNLLKADKNLQAVLAVAQMMEPVWENAADLWTAYAKHLIELEVVASDDPECHDAEAAS